MTLYSPPPAGTDVVWLSSARLRAGIVPGLGGRMLSLSLDGRELLWRDRSMTDDRLQPLVAPRVPTSGASYDEWQNWGGDKTWPAPQGSGPTQWPGPPDAILDGGAYVVEHVAERSITMRSSFDEKSGLRISRSILLSESADPEPGYVQVVSTLTNESARTIRWAAWEVAQFPFTTDDMNSADAGIYVEVNGESEVRSLFNPVGTIAVERQSASVLRALFCNAVGKLGFPHTTGRVALVHADGSTVRLEFRIVAEASQYPDGSPFQLWMQTPVSSTLPGLEGLRPTEPLVELEPTSPSTVLAPGKSVSLTVTWTPGQGI